MKIVYFNIFYKLYEYNFDKKKFVNLDKIKMLFNNKIENDNWIRNYKKLWLYWCYL